MKYFVAIVVLALTPVYAFSAEPASDGEGWISLFDGKTLDGWKVGGDPKSFYVEDGQLIAQAVGGNAHLFYAGDVEQHNFQNFQLKMDVMTTKGSNSGIYIHTAFQESDWPRKGYEIQVNVSHGDPKKSGGLYGIKDCFDPPAKDNTWYTQEITVQGKRIISKIDGQLIFDYTEPDDWKEEGRRLSSGTFAIQAHDPKSKVYFKNILVKPLEDSSAMPTFKELLRTDELIRVFVFGRVFHPIVIEMFGLAGGYHGFWIDGEHVGLTTQQLTVAGLAARANGFDCLARIPPVGYWYVAQCLEAGMGGVMGAQIHTAAQAEEFVRWAKFAPRGGRGLNLGGRDADYTHKPAARFVEEANRDQFVAIQIETAGAIDQADEIAALEGVDLLFIGPADLSLALGVVGQYQHPRLWEAIDHVAACARNRGKAWGALMPDPSFAERAVAGGCRMATMGIDLLAVRRGIEALKAAFAGHFPAASK